MPQFKIRFTLTSGYLSTVFVPGTEGVKTSDDAVRYVADLMHEGGTAIFDQADGTGVVAINMSNVGNAFALN
jgi:hypothetical protein